MTSQPQKRYKEYHGFYLRDHKEQTDRYRRQVRDYTKKFGALLAHSPRDSALDVGCATGMLTAFLKKQGFQHVVGVDINAELIEKARQNIDAEFHVADAVEFLQGGRQYDVIFLLNIVERIERDQLIDFMTAVYRSLHSDGFAIVRTPNMNNILAAAHLADDLTHCTGLTQQSFQQLAQAAGFRTIHFVNQFRMQNFKGKIKAILNWPLHRYLFWLRGGARPTIYYRNLYVQLQK